MSEETSLPLVNWSHVTDLIHPIKLLLRDTLQEVGSCYQIKVGIALFIFKVKYKLCCE